MRNTAHIAQNRISARAVKAVRIASLAAGALIVASCGTGEEETGGPIERAPAVPLVNSSGEIIGEVRGGDSDDGAVLLVDARGLPPGAHAMHIHEVGVCEPPGFESAGPHWNPTSASHGFRDPQGPHMGDLRNVTVDQNGNLRVQVVVPGTYLRTAGRNVQAGAHQILDASGAALVIHAQADDYVTDPSGASGDRIACAVLGEPQPGAVVTPQGGDAENAAQENLATNVGATEPSPGQNAFTNLAENSVIVNMDTSPPGPQQ